MQTACIPGGILLNSDIQIRGAPPEIKTQLKRRAAAEGLSMSQYLLRMLTVDLSLPTRREFSSRLRSRAPVEIGESAAAALQAARSERERQLGA